MASSTKGERRWASTRRGGMTVLGKVAVPKPINLPSQRLENHGLDPNVEIVPKGSLSWGTRSSSSGSNAWGCSSVLSPRAEGGSASPSQLSGRPSSGGGTRPSTAGSERTPDSTSNIWNSNSRPSSASGTLTSNNTSLTALRPRSAETRLGNSQLSRFAEPLAEGTAAWGASGAADKLGIAASSSDGFSLSSGDFPTLGSEKNSGKNMESLDHNSHGHPGSSFGGPSATTEKMEVAPGDDVSRPTDVKSGMDNSWKNDGPQHVEDGPHPGVERWHGDPYPFPNPNIPPHPYESWRAGAPINPPGGIWFRGPPGAPYGAPPMAGPGGFPMEPFPYYRPQVPAPGLVNSQTVPPHGAGPRGPHSKNGDLCRPIMEPYMRPGMPIRPGFYPGYYGPPMGFCNPNERDFPFMGMPGGPPVYNRYPNQNASESNSSNARSCEVRTQEQVESGPPHDSQRYYSIPVKQNKGWNKNVEEGQLDQRVMANAHPLGHATHPTSRENFQSEGHRKDELMKNEKMPLQTEETSSDLLEDKIGSTDPAHLKFHGDTSSGESGDINPVVENIALPKDHALIKQIEGLNQKVRASDGRHDFHREEPYGRGKLVNSVANYPVNEANAGVHLERHYPSGILVPVSRDMTVLAEDKGFGSTVGSVTTISRRSFRNVQERGDHGGKGRFNCQETDGWRKRSALSEAPGIVSVASSERTTNIQGKEQPPAVQATELSGSDGELKDASTLSMFDPCDSQRAKMREIAKQRAVQLQQEEEERIREQKAKAFAKLEELNRRSANQGKEASRDKDSVPSHADVMQKQEESNIKIELQFGSHQYGEMGSTLAHGKSPSKASMGLEFNLSSGVMCSQTNQHLHQDDAVMSQKQSFPATDDAHINDVAGPNVQVSEISRQKRAGYKYKHNVHSIKNLTEKPVIDAKENSTTVVTVLKEVDVKGVSSSSESVLPVELPTVSDSLVQPKRKNNRKSKHKVDESFAVSSTSVQKEPDVSASVTESMKLNIIDSMPEPSNVQPPVDSKDVSQSLEIHPSSPHDDAQYRSNNSWKPQHARKVPRNSQGRSTEKSYGNDVVWAPVKSHNKIEGRDDNEQKAEEVAVPSTRGDNAVPSSSRSKRAEMERYVPKAAIKEPGQQGSIQLSASPSTEQSIPDSTGSKGQSSSQTIERMGRPVESRHLGSKPKQAQNHGSWRQRASNESSFVQVSGDRSSSMMNPTKNTDVPQQTQKPKELQKGSPAEPVAHLVKVQPSKQVEQPAEQQLQPVEVNEDNGGHGWNIVDEPISFGTLSVVKDHAILGRGKRNPFKGQKGAGNTQNFDRKSHNCAEADADYSETSQPDRPTSSKGKSVAHWQPKSQTHVIYKQENMARGQQSVTVEGEKTFKSEASENGSLQLKQHNNQGTAKSIGQPQIHSASESKDVSTIPNMGSQEAVVGRKAASLKDRACPPKDTLVEAESAPIGPTDGTSNEQRPSSSGHRRNGNYNGRFNRNNECRGDRSFITQEHRQTYAPANREKQRHNARYEYQPVGPYTTTKRGNNTEGQFENQHAGPRFRDRGQGTHSRRGGASFYGRQRDNNQTDAGYE